MTHCCNEPLQLKTRWVSSQVLGDSTAHTVTIRSIGFMHEIPEPASLNGQHKAANETGAAAFQSSLKKACRPALACPPLEVEAEHQAGLVTLEIDEIQGRSGSGGAAPCLNAPACRQPRARRQLEIGGRADEQRLSREFHQADSFIFLLVARFTADQDARTYLRHHPERSTDRGFLLRRSFADKPCPLGLIDQVDGSDGKVRNQLPVECEREFRPVIANDRSGGLIDTPGVAFHRNGQAERPCVSIQKPVAEIGGKTLPG